MYCPDCGNIKLEMGIAIDPKYVGHTIVPTQRTLKPEEVKLIDCIKCPKCGWSDDDTF
mgnify:CR=1 FL=1